jgi:hypothetical protein
LSNRNAKLFFHAFRFGKEIQSAMKQSTTQTTATIPMNHMPIATPEASGRCRL